MQPGLPKLIYIFFNIRDFFFGSSIMGKVGHTMSIPQRSQTCKHIERNLHMLQKPTYQHSIQILIL